MFVSWVVEYLTTGLLTSSSQPAHWLLKWLSSLQPTYWLSEQLQTGAPSIATKYWIMFLHTAGPHYTAMVYDFCWLGRQGRIGLITLSPPPWRSSKPTKQSPKCPFYCCFKPCATPRTHGIWRSKCISSSHWFDHVAAKQLTRKKEETLGYCPS
jgi:hypothetical protein